jgi:hypothetical protein
VGHYKGKDDRKVGEGGGDRCCSDLRRCSVARLSTRVGRFEGVEDVFPASTPMVITRPQL